MIGSSIRSCIDDIQHSNGVVPSHSVYADYLAWLQSQPQSIQDLAAEFNYGLCMRFKDGRYWVCGYTVEAGVAVSPFCPQCHGDEAANQHPGVLLLDPAILREKIAKH